MRSAIPEAAQLVIQAGAMAQGGEVFVLDMGDPVRITELAVKMSAPQRVEADPVYRSQRGKARSW